MSTFFFLFHDSFDCECVHYAFSSLYYIGNQFFCQPLLLLCLKHFHLREYSSKCCHSSAWCKALRLIKPSNFSLNRISMYIFHIDHSTILRMTSHNSLCVCHSCCVITIIGRKGHCSTNMCWTQTISVIASIYREQKLAFTHPPSIFCGTIITIFVN